MASDGWYDPDSDDVSITFRMGSLLHGEEERPSITKNVGTVTDERCGEGRRQRTRIGRLVGCRIYGERIFREVLVLHRTYLIREARGRGLGAMVRRYIDLYADNDTVVVCRPFP